MLREIKFIQNIGRFETAKPTHDATFGQCTLVFGENGWGKSTFADILRSLTTNNSAILEGRKTLASDAPPKAVLRFSNCPAVFESGTWTGCHPRISVYDSAFINDNVFSGDVVSADHLKNQYGLVVGDEGVRLVGRIVELDGENRENNKTIAAAESELTTVIRTVGLPTMPIDDFRALNARPDIDAAITAKDNQVQRVRRARELKTAAEPSLVPIPSETANLRHLLTQSIDEVAEAAVTRVREHVAAHQCEPKEGATVHESWLEAGMAFVRDEECPFCGQRLADRALVDAYKAFFSERYKVLGTSVKKAREALGRYTSGDFRQTVTRLGEQNAGHFRYWHEAAKLDLLEAGDIDAIITEIEHAATRLDALFAGKQANLTEAVIGKEADAALDAWDAGRAAITAVNARIACDLFPFITTAGKVMRLSFIHSG
jgi:wobble nucleotide-excising tRNase